MTPRFPALANATDVRSARALQKRLKDRLYQCECRTKQKQKLQALENEVQALRTQIARLYQPLYSRQVVASSAQVLAVQQIPLDPLKNHARTIVMRFFQVYQYGYSVSMAPLQESFLRSILDPDVEGADLRTADAFVQQWRLNGQHFALDVLEPQGWKTQIVDACVMVTVKVMLYLRFLRQTIGMLFPALKNGEVGFEVVQPLTAGTTAVVGTYTFVVNPTGKVISLLTNLQLLESLRRVLRSLDNVVRLTEGTRIALDSGTITLA